MILREKKTTIETRNPIGNGKSKDSITAVPREISIHAS
jgi:hypothetical protein